MHFFLMPMIVRPLVLRVLQDIVNLNNAVLKNGTSGCYERSWRIGFRLAISTHSCE